MKTLILVLSFLLLSSVSVAQVAFVDYSVPATGAPTHYANSAGDSVSSIPLVCPPSGKFPSIQGLFPDSIRVISSATTDTMKIDIAFSAMMAGPNYVTRTAVDTLSTTGAVHGTLITRSLYSGADIVRLSLIQRSSGASVVAANNKALVKLRMYYTVPRGR